MRRRTASRPIIHYGSAGIKRVYEEGINGTELFVEPFIGLDEHQCVGIGFAAFEPDSKRFRGAWFWGEGGPADPLALGRALAIIEALPQVRPNTLCGAYLAAKGTNGDGSTCVHRVLSELGEQVTAILDRPPDCLNNLLQVLRRRHYPIDATVFAQSA
ncbi:MAG: hypothetical protein WC497_04565 [Patescibacteria group bacterium]